METNLHLWQTHDWCDRRPLVIDFSKKGILFICRKCNRGFAKDATGGRYAVQVSALAVFRLADEVTSRWLSEACPIEQPQKDCEDKESRLLDGPSRKVKPGKVLSVAPIFNSDPASVYIEVLCSVCGEAGALALNLDQPSDLTWLLRRESWSCLSLKFRGS